MGKRGAGLSRAAYRSQEIYEALGVERLTRFVSRLEGQSAGPMLRPVLPP